MPKNEFAGAIWTNHALDRLGERGLSDSLAADTLRFPDEILNGKNPGTQSYVKHVGSSQVTLIVGKSDEGKPLILSAWIDPPLPGTKDAKKREEWQNYKKSNFWGKVWYQVKKQVFNQ